MVNGECPEVCRKFSIEKIVPYHNEFFTTKKINKVVNLLGGETKKDVNQLLFFIYDDGTVDKQIIIE